MSKSVFLVAILSANLQFTLADYAQASPEIISKVCSVVDCIEIAINSAEDAYKRYEPEFKEFYYSFPTAEQISSAASEIGARIEGNNEYGALFSISLSSVSYRNSGGVLDTAVIFKGIRFHGFGRNAPDAIYKGEVFGEDGFLVNPPAGYPEGVIEIVNEEFIPASGFWVSRSEGEWSVIRFEPSEMNLFVRRAYDRRRVDQVTNVFLGRRDSLAALVASANRHTQASKAALDRLEDTDVALRIKRLDASREHAEARVRDAVARYKALVRRDERYRQLREFSDLIGAASSVLSAYASLEGKTEAEIQNRYSAIERGLALLNGIKEDKFSVLLGEFGTFSIEVPDLGVSDLDFSGECCTLHKHDITIYSIGPK